jgi:hypothetical protein
MTPRRVTAILCVVAVAALIAAAFSTRWLVADVRTPDINGSLRIGLVQLRACVATVDGSHCDSARWSQFPSGTTAASWIWLGRMLYGLLYAAGIGLVVVAGSAIGDLRFHGALTPARATMLACLAIVPLMAGYYFLAPSVFSALDAGRGFALAAVGAGLGAFAAGRERGDD